MNLSRCLRGWLATDLGESSFVMNYILELLATQHRLYQPVPQRQRRAIRVVGYQTLSYSLLADNHLEEVSARLVG